MEIPLARTERALIVQVLSFARTEGHPNSMEIPLARTEGALMEQVLPFERTQGHPNSMEIPLCAHRARLDRA